MKSFFQRIHDSHAGTRKPAPHDPYQVWEPPKLDRERNRYYGRTDPDPHGTNTQRLSEKNRHQATSGYASATVPTATRNGGLHSRFTSLNNSSPVQISESKPQRHRLSSTLQQSRGYSAAHVTSYAQRPDKGDDPLFVYPGRPTESPPADPALPPQRLAPFLSSKDRVGDGNPSKSDHKRPPRDTNRDGEKRKKKHAGAGGELGSGEGGNGDRAVESERGQNRERNKEREKRENDTDRDQVRVREKEMNRDRARDGDAGRKRRRDRDGERDTDRERETDRERDKDRDRERDRDGNKSERKDRDRGKDRSDDGPSARDRNRGEDRKKGRGESATVVGHGHHPRDGGTTAKREDDEERERREESEQEKKKDKEKEKEKEKEKIAGRISGMLKDAHRGLGDAKEGRERSRTNDRERVIERERERRVRDQERPRHRESESVRTEARHTYSNEKDKKGYGKMSDEDRGYNSSRQTDKISRMEVRQVVRNLSAMASTQPRADEGDSPDGSPSRQPMLHRRHRTEDGLASPPAAKNSRHEPQVSTGFLPSSNPSMNQPTTSFPNSNEHYGNISSTPRIPNHISARDQITSHNRGFSQPTPSGSDTETTKPKEPHRRIRNTSIDKRAEIGYRTLDPKPPELSHKPRYWNAEYKEDDRINGTRVKEMKNLSSRQPTSSKEALRNLPQAVHSQGPFDKGFDLDPTVPHFVSIRAGQGPSDLAYGILKPAAAPHAISDTILLDDQFRQDRPHGELQKPNTHTARDDPNGPVSRSDMPTTNRQDNPAIQHLQPESRTIYRHQIAQSPPPNASTAENSRHLWSELASNRSELPRSSVIHNIHLNPSSSFGNITAAPAEPTPGAKPPNHPFKQLTSARIPRTPTISGLRALSNEEAANFDKPATPEPENPLNTPTPLNPPNLSRSSNPTLLAPFPHTGRTHQDVNLDSLTRKGQTHSLSSGGPKIPKLSSSVWTSEPENSTHLQVSVPTPSRGSKALPDVSSATVPQLVASYEVRHLLSHGAPMKTLAVTPSNSADTEGTPVLATSRTSYPPRQLQSTIHNPHPNNTDAPGLPHTSRQQTWSIENKHVSESRDIPKKHLTLHTQGTVMTAPPINPPLHSTYLSPHEALAENLDPLPTPSAERSHESRLLIETKQKPSQNHQTHSEEIKFTLSQTSARFRTQDLPNRSTYEPGPVSVITHEKIGNDRTNTPLNDIQKQVPIRDLPDAPSGGFPISQLVSLDRYGVPVRASPQHSLESVMGIVNQAEILHDHLHDDDAPQATRIFLTQAAFGSRRDERDPTSSVRARGALQPGPPATYPDRRPPVQTASSNTPPAGYYRPDIQHLGLAEILSSPTPINKSKLVNTDTIDDERRGYHPPSRATYDQTSGKVQHRTPSPTLALAPTLTVKSKGSPSNSGQSHEHHSNMLGGPHDFQSSNHIPSAAATSSYRHGPGLRDVRYTSSPNLHPPRIPRYDETSKHSRITKSPSTAATSAPPQTSNLTIPVTDAGISDMFANTQPANRIRGPVSTLEAAPPQMDILNIGIRATATYPIAISSERSKLSKRHDAPLRPQSRNRGATGAYNDPLRNLDLGDPPPPRSSTPQDIPHTPPGRLPMVTPFAESTRKISTPAMRSMGDGRNPQPNLSNTIGDAYAPPWIPETISRPPSADSILKTPSSLAPSMLKPTASRTSIPISQVSQDSRKKSLFGMFKSKVTRPYEVWQPPADQDAERKQARSKADSPKLTAVDPNTTATPILTASSKVASSAAIPVSSGPKSSSSRVFTPFRYLTSRRNRTMSAASIEAQDGTAPNTVVGSPTASMHSQPPIQPPPRRDPLLATQEWRHQEAAEIRARGGKVRRQRPGVVFDVGEDPVEDRQRSRPMRSRVHAESGTRSS